MWQSGNIHLNKFQVVCSDFEKCHDSIFFLLCSDINTPTWPLWHNWNHYSTQVIIWYDKSDKLIVNYLQLDSSGYLYVNTWSAIRCFTKCNNVWDIWKKKNTKMIMVCGVCWSDGIMEMKSPVIQCKFLTSVF